MKPNTFIIKPLAVLLLASMAMLASCEKTDNDTDLRTPSGTSGEKYTVLPPTVVARPFAEVDLSATRSAGRADDGEQLLSATDDMVTSATFGNAAPQTRAVETLEAGVYYRIVIYDATEYDAGTLNIVEQRLGKVGATQYYADNGSTVAPLSLYSGKYVAFCYSYNTKIAADLPALTAASITMNTSKDLMTALVRFEVGSAAVTLPAISLAHRLCKVTSTIKAEDFDNNAIADTPAPTLTLLGTSFCTGCNLDIATNALVRTGEGGNTSGYPFKLVKGYGGREYTSSIFVFPESSKLLYVSYSFQVVGTDKVTTANKVALYSGTIELAESTNMSFTIKAVPVYVLAETPPEIGGATWALSNLDANDGTNFKFEAKPWISGVWDGINVPKWNASNDLSTSTNDYWNWGEKAPTMDDAVTAPAEWTSLDPCRTIKSDKWMLPTKEHLEGLLANMVKNKWVMLEAGQTPVKTDENGYIAPDGTRADGLLFAANRKEAIFLPAAGYKSVDHAWSEKGALEYYSSTYDSALGYYYRFTGGYQGGRFEEYKVVVDFFYGATLRCVKNDAPAADVTPPGGVTDGGWTDDPFDNVEIPVGD